MRERDLKQQWMAMREPTKALVDFLESSRIGDFPREVVETSKRCLLDWIGVAVGAMNDPSVEILMDALREIGGRPQATVIGHGMKTDILNASLINGVMGHVLDYDDAHMGSRNHPSAPLIPALLSTTECRRHNGPDLLTAYILGFEVSTRIGLALGKGYYDQGWHASPVLGRFGAAAGVGHLLGLNAQMLRHALGLAATQAGGIRMAFGTMGKAFNVGKAAADGLFSAIVAHRGFTAPHNILDESSGFPGMWSEAYNPRCITDGLGSTYHILDISLKPYAACLLVHPVIDGLISIRGEHSLDPEAVRAIDLEVAPICSAVTSNPDPRNGLEGKFSICFCAAVAALKGHARNSIFTDEMVRDSRIRALMYRTKVRVNPALGESEAFVTVRTEEGIQYSRHVSTPKGGPGNPLELHQIIEKFTDLAGESLGREKTQRIMTAVLDLEKVRDVSELVSLCCIKRDDGTV